MFSRLKESRSFLMGLAILGVIIFHASFSISSYKLRLIHDNLCCGVDLFLFFSGIGACHSIAAHGGKGYLKNRLRRILPGLMPILILWSAWMVFTGVMSWKEFLGSVTLLGWWFGQYKQLNWYFSAVWAFFLLAVPLYQLFRRCRRPVLLWLGLCLITLLFQILFPGYKASMLSCRALIFLSSMLFGRLEQLGCKHTKVIALTAGLFLVWGLWWMVLEYPYDCWGYGYRLGLWWYPYALFTPGTALLVSALWSRIRHCPVIGSCGAVIEQLGKSSSEILMIHMALFKAITNVTTPTNPLWFFVIVLCLAAGVGYQKWIVPHLPFSQVKLQPSA